MPGRLCRIFEFIVLAAVLASFVEMCFGPSEPAGTGPDLFASTVSTQDNQPWVSAYASLLMEANTSSILFRKRAFERVHPASLTKMLTALIILERCRLDDVVTVSEDAASQPGSSMGLSPGDMFTVEDLLYGLMLNSGNDAAWALAEHCAGSIENFCDMMNARAREIGAVNSRFANPHGLTDPNHFTTAYDLGLIARTCLKHPYFRTVVSTVEREVAEVRTGRKIVLGNTNRLLTAGKGIDGIKTGTTDAAGYCLVASATRDSMKLVAVVLDSADRWGDALHLIEWGFENYKLVRLARAWEEIGTVRCPLTFEGSITFVPAVDLAACVPAYDPSAHLRVEVPKRIFGWVRRGAVVGEAWVYWRDTPVGYSQLLAGSEAYPVNPVTIMIRTVTGLAVLLSKMSLL